MIKLVKFKETGKLEPEWNEKLKIVTDESVNLPSLTSDFTYNEDLKAAQNAGNCICGVRKIKKFFGPP